MLVLRGSHATRKLFFIRIRTSAAKSQKSSSFQSLIQVAFVDVQYLAEHVGVGLEISRRSSVFAFDLYLVFNNMDHDKKIKQMRLCADFNAGPSTEQPLLFLFYLKRTSVAVFFFQSLIQAAFLGVQSQAEHVGVELELSRRSSVFTFDY